MLRIVDDRLLHALRRMRRLHALALFAGGLLFGLAGSAAAPVQLVPAPSPHETGEAVGRQAPASAPNAIATDHAPLSLRMSDTIERIPPQR